jgi:hypothetical protein
LTLTEFAHIDEGDEGTTYVFTKAERVRADHPAVEASPSSFAEIDHPSPCN